MGSPTGPNDPEIVESNVDVSLRRMDVDCLDLLQFHWWDYDDPRYLEALGHLSDLRDAGKIRHLGLTNFDTERLKTIVENGIRVVSNQVQFSLVDLRPAAMMAPYCQANGIHLLTYGTLCGGLLSAKYLGLPEPTAITLDTASLKKYKQMIDAWGGWTLFQELLSALNATAAKHGVSIANVATRFILDRPAVAGVIAGVRLGISHHREDNARVFGLTLDSEDEAAIEAVTSRAEICWNISATAGTNTGGVNNGAPKPLVGDP